MILDKPSPSELVDAQLTGAMLRNIVKGIHLSTPEMKNVNTLFKEFWKISGGHILSKEQHYALFWFTAVILEKLVMDAEE